MTTITQFNPSATANFQFNATLDNVNYNIVITYIAYRGDYYFNIYDANNNRVVSRPLIGSPLNYDINLIKDYFTTSTLVFRSATQQFEVTP